MVAHGRSWISPTALFVGLVAACFGLAGNAEARTKITVSAATSQFGSYMAARFAQSHNDGQAAARFYKIALARDPRNKALVRRTFFALLNVDNWQEAAPLARRLIRNEPKNHIARMFLGLRAFKAGKFKTADKHFKAASYTPIGELTGTLTRAWLLHAQKRTTRALRRLDSLKDAGWARFHIGYHRALIADAAGRARIARKAYEQVFRPGPQMLRVAMAYASHAAVHDNDKAALTILQRNLKRSRSPHPSISALNDQITAGRPVQLLVRTATDGIAEVFYGLGHTLISEGDVQRGAFYLRFALFVRPTFDLALVSLGNVLDNARDYESANAAYARIEKSSPVYALVQVSRAFNLDQLDKVEQAKALLESLSRAQPKDIRPISALGYIMRARKRYSEAVKYYDRVIALIGEPQPKHWTHFYARGVSYERLKQWPKAEVDLQKAIELSPDQPSVLNYLGYSWVDQKRHLKKAMAYIAKAVRLRPDDGYIVDSLGWAHYRLGNFEKAVKYLERAVELKSQDPVINDHLGDALWRVGRKVEARYQWEQSLTLKPEAAEIPKIKLKLREGLTPTLRKPAAPVSKPGETAQPGKRVSTTTSKAKPIR